MDYSKLTDAEIAELLATRVMGWIESVNNPNVWVDFAGNIQVVKDDWQPCTDLNQAVMCAEKWMKQSTCHYWEIRCYYDSRKEIYYQVFVVDVDVLLTETKNTSPARALCEAVLMAAEAE